MSSLRCTQVRTQKDSSHTHKCVYDLSEYNASWDSLRPLLVDENGGTETDSAFVLYEYLLDSLMQGHF